MENVNNCSRTPESNKGGPSASIPNEYIFIEASDAIRRFTISVTIHHLHKTIPNRTVPKMFERLGATYKYISAIL